MPANFLADAPKYFRAAKSAGAAPTVARDGGDYGAGLITGVSTITAGEALGHGLWIDAVMLAQVRDAINAAPNGVKSRWTHPDMSGDGLGKLTSRIKNARLSADGRQVLADQHFLAIAHNAPDGDLAGYLMDLAEEDPAGYGLSIVFDVNYGEMDRFTAMNEDEAGNFSSPDPANINNYPHARVAALSAADAVDEPAANPSGLFHRPGDVAREADALAAFALGISDQRPEAASLGINPDRLRGFAARFLSTHNLTIGTKEPMSKTATAPQALSAETTVETPVADATPVVETPTPEAKPAATPASESSEGDALAAGRAEAKRFQAAFGDNGLKYFAEGLSFEDAQKAETKALRAEVAELRQSLAAKNGATGEQTPVGFNAGDKPKATGFASRIKIK